MTKPAGPHPLIATLEAATQGLLFPSETDAPLTPFFWPSEAKSLTPDLVLRLAGLPAGTAVSTQDFDEFFAPVVTEEDWQNDEEKAEVRRFQALAKALKDNLKDVAVFRAGETNISVFVVGKASGGFAGVATRIVET